MKKIIIVIAILLLSTAVYAQAGGLELKIFKVNYADIESLYQVANDLKSAEGRVSFDRKSNNLIVLDHPQNLERIAGVIKSLDIREKQVEIKVMAVEAGQEFFEKFGIELNRTIIPEAKFRAIIEALETSKNTSLRSSMMVRTTSNQPAQIRVSTDEVIGNSILIYENGTTVVSPLRMPIGNFLEVLPTVNNDGTITVSLSPSVSTLEKGNTPYERNILTNVVINDGDTLTIGELDSEGQNVTSESTFFGIPLSSKTKTENRKVVVFLTAKVVD